jgi:hypothetical protein
MRISSKKKKRIYSFAKHDAVRVYGRSDTQPHSFSASAFEAGECVVEQPSYFIFGKTVAVTNCTRSRVSLRANMDLMAYNVSLLPPLNEPRPSIPYPSH